MRKACCTHRRTDARFSRRATAEVVGCAALQSQSGEPHLRTRKTFANQENLLFGVQVTPVKLLMEIATGWLEAIADAAFATKLIKIWQ
ncbi:hypothetical protein LBMAG49_11940 [Planctomycetota bacterium]|nr:hypothetical protein LBMAG49_11940 [Planctomycetota bacterium]